MAARRPSAGSKRASRRASKHASMLIMVGDLAILALAGWMTYKRIAAGEPVLVNLAAGLALYLLGWLGLHWFLRAGR